jgi:hypothetical protein
MDLFYDIYKKGVSQGSDANYQVLSTVYATFGVFSDHLAARQCDVPVRRPSFRWLHRYVGQNNGCKSD